MRFALSAEKTQRLLVVCDSQDEHTRVRGGVDLVGRRATQAKLVAELSGLPIGSEGLTSRISDLLTDIERVGLKIALPDLTGKEQIFATHPKQLHSLERVAAFAASVLGEEQLIEAGLTAGIWQAPARHPRFRQGAEQCWQDLRDQIQEIGLLGLPRVAITHDPYAL